MSALTGRKSSTRRFHRQIRSAGGNAGAWSAPSLLKQTTSLPPALVADPAGGLDLAVVGTDGQVSYAHFAGTQWSSFKATGVKSALAPALAA